MSFPRTAVLDDFNRADGDAGANWAEMMRSGNDFNISGNQLAEDGWNAEIWNPATYGPACEVFVTLATLPAQGDMAQVFARMADVVADANGYDGYSVRAYRWDNGGTDTMNLTVKRVDDSVQTTLGSSVNITDHGDGDKVGLRCIGAALELWYDDGAGWELRSQRSDATYDVSGYLALYLGNNGGVLDDFGGGTIKPVASMWHHYVHH